MEDLELSGLVYSYGAYIAFAGQALGRKDNCLVTKDSAEKAGGNGFVTTLGKL